MIEDKITNKFYVISEEKLEEKEQKVKRETRYGSENQEVYVAYKDGYVDALSDLKKSAVVVELKDIVKILYNVSERKELVRPKALALLKMLGGEK